MQQNATYSNSFFCAMHSTYLQYYVLSKQYLTALTYYYDFNVYIKYVEKKNICMNYGHALGQWKGF